MKNIILILFLLFGINNIIPTLSSNAYAMSLDDDEEDAEDVQDLLDMAKKAGKNESFSKANELLKKAKQYSINNEDVSDIKNYVDVKKQKRDARLERARLAKLEKQRLARLERERQERARVARTYSSSSSLSYVMISFDSVCGFAGCINKNLRISGGAGSFSPSYNGAVSGAIHKGYNGSLAGRYNYSVEFDNNFCTGSFYVSGSKSNFRLALYKGCSDAGSGEY